MKKFYYFVYVFSPYLAFSVAPPNKEKAFNFTVEECLLKFKAVTPTAKCAKAKLKKVKIEILNRSEVIATYSSDACKSEYFLAIKDNFVVTEQREFCDNIVNLKKYMDLTYRSLNNK